MTKHRAYFLKTWRTDNRHRGGCPFCHIYDHAQLSLIYAFPGSDNDNTPLIGAFPYAQYLNIRLIICINNRK